MSWTPHKRTIDDFLDSGIIACLPWFTRFISLKSFLTRLRNTFRSRTPGARLTILAPGSITVSRFIHSWFSGWAFAGCWPNLGRAVWLSTILHCSVQKRAEYAISSISEVLKNSSGSVIINASGYCSMNQDVEFPELTYTRCGHAWIPRITDKPRQCDKCRSPYWNELKWKGSRNSGR